MTIEDDLNATKFHAKEAWGGRRRSGIDNQNQMQKLSSLNTGEYNGEWENKELLHRKDNMAVLDAIASTVELTDYQKKESRRLFDKFPKGTFGYRVELIAFSICVIIAEQDGREFDPAEPISSIDDLDDVESDTLFHKFVLEEGYYYTDVETVINKIQDRFVKWGWI